MERACTAPWKKIVLELGLGSAALIGRNHAARRVYRKGGEIWKVHLKIQDTRSDGVPWHGNLQEEFQIAQLCQGISNIPRPLRYVETDCYYAAAYAFCAGQRLKRIPPGALLRLTILWQLATVLWRLSCRGVAHNDVRENNILVDHDRRSTRVYLIDFDRAARMSRLAAFYNNFLRIKRGAARSFHGSWARLAVWQLSPGAVGVFHYFRGQLRSVMRRGAGVY